MQHTGIPYCYHQYLLPVFLHPGAVRERMLRQSGKRVDVSTASTWKDLDGMDLV